jgi:UDP-2,3-diacylglucosamine pyrophosphatase LpxH
MTTTWEYRQAEPGHYPRMRAIFISDMHLGTRAAQAHRLLDFLRHHEGDVIDLAGDIVDFWKVRRPTLAADAQRRAPEAFTPGAQRCAPRVCAWQSRRRLCGYVGLRFGGVEIHQDIVHTTAKGRRYSVVHGDELDVILQFALWINHPLNWCRWHFGLGYWSLSLPQVPR